MADVEILQPTFIHDFSDGSPFHLNLVDGRVLSQRVISEDKNSIYLVLSAFGLGDDLANCAIVVQST